VFARAQDAPNARLVIPNVDSPLSVAGAEDDGSVRFVTQPSSAAVSPRAKRRQPMDSWTLYPHWFPEMQINSNSTAAPTLSVDRVSPFDPTAGLVAAHASDGAIATASGGSAAGASTASTCTADADSELVTRTLPLTVTASPLQTPGQPLSIALTASSAESTSSGSSSRRLEPVPPSEGAPSFSRMQSTSPRMLLARRTVVAAAASNNGQGSIGSAGAGLVASTSVSPTEFVDGGPAGSATDATAGSARAASARLGGESRKDEWGLRVSAVKQVVPTTHAVDLQAPPPSGCFVSPVGVVSLRRFALNHLAVPSLRHIQPPPIPEPISMLQTTDVQYIMSVVMLSALQDLARHYLERRHGSAQLSVSMASRGPVPCPWTGQVVFDLYDPKTIASTTAATSSGSSGSSDGAGSSFGNGVNAAISRSNSVSAALGTSAATSGTVGGTPLPVPFPVTSHVMHEFFQESLRQLADPGPGAVSSVTGAPPTTLSSPTAFTYNVVSSYGGPPAAKDGAWDAGIPALEFDSRFESGACDAKSRCHVFPWVFLLIVSDDVIPFSCSRLLLRGYLVMLLF
jgi:hypothetical protein